LLDVAFRFLRDQVNSYLLTRMGTSTIQVSLSNVVDDAGRYSIPDDSLGLSLISIEEERVLKSQVPEHTQADGKHVFLPPMLRLNFFILFAAHFKVYETALSALSQVLTFFQANPTFTTAEKPDLDPRIARLNVELQSLSFEQLNQIWAFIGGKQLPSVAYKVRLLPIQDGAQIGVQPAITRIQAELHRT